MFLEFLDMYYVVPVMYSVLPVIISFYNHFLDYFCKFIKVYRLFLPVMISSYRFLEVHVIQVSVKTCLESHTCFDGLEFQN
jgi:hypothetical protein